MAGHMSNHMFNHMAGHISGRMAGHMSHRMLNHMFEHMLNCMAATWLATCQNTYQATCRATWLATCLVTCLTTCSTTGLGACLPRAWPYAGHKLVARYTSGHMTDRISHHMSGDVANCLSSCAPSDGVLPSRWASTSVYRIRNRRAGAVLTAQRRRKVGGAVYNHWRGLSCERARLRKLEMTGRARILFLQKSSSTLTAITDDLCQSEGLY